MTWTLLLAEQGGVLENALKFGIIGAVIGAVVGGLYALILGVIQLQKKNRKGKDAQGKPSEE